MNPCPNFRDAGEWVNCISGDTLMPEGVLFRGGKTTLVSTAADIGSPGTIINLKRGHDQRVFGADYHFMPIANTLEVYETGTKGVRRWLNEVMVVLASSELRLPVLVHCASGKDRTGVVIAALLGIIDIPTEVIVEEYLVSEGEINEQWLRAALQATRPAESYFDRVDLATLQSSFGKQCVRRQTNRS